MKGSLLFYPTSLGYHAGQKAMVVLIAATWLGFAFSKVGATPKEQEKLTDRQITSAVDYKLLTDAGLLNEKVFASTTEGIVTLAGTAGHLIAKERATMLAQTLRGVRGVVNTIDLQIPSIPDDELGENVASALLYDAATARYEIKPEARSGVVTLNGSTHSYYEKQLAEYVTKCVKGVKEVKNNITVMTRSDRSDAEIAVEVRRIIDIDGWLSPNFISTDVKDGIVTLTGAVGSSAQLSRVSLSAWTAGVKALNVDGLKIEPWAKSSYQRSETVAIKDDQQIKQAVQDTFVYDPRVYTFNPNVEVENAIVTLTGVVDNLKAKHAAEQDAKNTVGVWRVRNLLKVRPAKSLDDGTVSQNVKSALARDPAVDSDEITASARRGIVTLSGTVDSIFKKAEAEDVASRASGVLDIRNNLAVSTPSAGCYDTSSHSYSHFQPYYFNLPPYNSTLPYTSDSEVKFDIENALVWSPWVDRGNINVNVVNGVATLTGKAGGWFEYRKATECAYEGGARQVFNNILIIK